MKLTAIPWDELSRLPAPQLKSEIFSILQVASQEVMIRDEEDVCLLELVPRLNELLSLRPELSSYKEPISSLARIVGLWNYIDKSSASPVDRLLAESVSSELLDGLTLHRKQVEALGILLSGQNVILSAPTSFGKSILIDALLASKNFSRVAIVVPTIALMDECRRRISRRFKADYEVVLHGPSSGDSRKAIFLGTQERLVNRTDLGALDLVILDEFYKLDAGVADERRVILNAAMYQLLKSAKQFFFLGPNVDAVECGDESWKFYFFKTRFSTVAVDVYDVSDVADKAEKLKEELSDEANWPALVFVSSPDKANRLGYDLAASRAPVPDTKECVEWIASNFGEHWELGGLVAKGILLHHGRLPRALTSLFVRMFNGKSAPIMICTSTLIEGVNTAARSIMIYDKTISRKKYDFFTFANIRGRAGRLGEHYVGKVFLFNEPPSAENTSVTPSMFDDLASMEDEVLIQIQSEAASEVVDRRIEQLTQRMKLSREELRKVSLVGVETALKIRTAFEEAGDLKNLYWTGWPKYSQMETVFQVLCKALPANRFGCRSSSQLTLLVSRLRKPISMKEFFLGQSNSAAKEPWGMDFLFSFLRSCEYVLPQHLAVLELFVRKRGEADYSLLISSLPNWFRPEVLKQLDEQGVPIQISERYHHPEDTLKTLIDKLRAAAQDPFSSLSAFERDWVLSATV